MKRNGNGRPPPPPPPLFLFKQRDLSKPRQHPYPFNNEKNCLWHSRLYCSGNADTGYGGPAHRCSPRTLSQRKSLVRRRHKSLPPIGDENVSIHVMNSLSEQQSITTLDLRYVLFFFPPSTFDVQKRRETQQDTYKIWELVTSSSRRTREFTSKLPTTKYKFSRNACEESS